MHVTQRIPPWALAIAAMLLVQLSNAASIGIIEQVGSAGTAWLRMCCGAVILLAVVRPSIRRLRMRDLPQLLVLGAATALMMSLFLSAVERIPLGTAVAIEFLGPLTVAAIASRSIRALIWPIVAFGGVLLLSEPWQGEIDLVGAGFALAGGIAWGLYNVFTQLIGDRFEGISGLAFTIPIAALMLTPFGLPQVLHGRFSWLLLLATAGIALMTPVLAFSFEMLALRRMHHSAFGTLLAVEPALSVVVGVVLLSQLPNVLQLVGIAFVVGAGAAAQIGGLRQPPAAVAV